MASPIELGPFLRSRREALTPADVGLPTGTRRRTPGLRRAELATLAGISVDYLIRLEQGRDRHPSAQVLAALADALRLREEDLDVVRKFAVVSQGAELCPTAAPPARTVRPTVRALLDHLEPAPAVVVNRLMDVLAWTTGYERLAAPLGVFDAERPNLLRYLFAHPAARAAYPDWDDVADGQVADLHTSCRDDGEGAELVDELERAAGPAFADRWTARRPVPLRPGVERVAHPRAGTLRLSIETMQLAGSDDQRILVYLPADDVTAAAIDRLAGRHPGALRAVAD